MSYYTPKTNQVMNLGRINFLTSKWIDSSGNSNDAVLVKSFCAQSAVGTGGNFVVTHANTGGRLDFGTDNFEIGVTARQDTTSAGAINIIAKQNGGPSYGGVTMQRSGQASTIFIGQDAGTNYVTYTNNTYFINTTNWRAIRVVRTGARTLQIFSSLNGAEETDDTAGFIRVSSAPDVGDINVSSTGNFTFCPKGTSFNNLYFKNAAGVKVLDLPLSGSGLDVSGNATVVGTSGTVTYKGLTDRTHTNLQYGCDIYTKDGDATNRAFWYYVPYKNGTPIIADNSGGLVTARAGYAVTLLRSCLPYRADAPLNLSETKIQMPDIGIYDKSSTTYYEDALRGTAFYDATSAATKRTWYQEELNGKYQNSVTKTGYKNKWFVGSYAQVLDVSFFGLTGRSRAMIAFSVEQTGNALRQINKYLHGKNYT